MLSDREGVFEAAQGVSKVNILVLLFIYCGNMEPGNAGVFFLFQYFRCIVFERLLLICSSKKSAKGKRPGKGGNRFWKSIGLGFKTPREAIEGLISSFGLSCRSILNMFYPLCFET